MKPEYLHILLNPYLTHGLPLAALALFIGLITKSPGLTRGGLFLVLFTCLLTFPTVEYGEAAYDRLTALTDDAGQEWLDEHLRRAQLLAPLFYLGAAGALAALVASFRWPRWAFPLAIATLIIAGSLCGVGGYIAYAGGRVTHAELRPKG